MYVNIRMHTYVHPNGCTLRVCVHACVSVSVCVCPFLQCSCSWVDPVFSLILGSTLGCGSAALTLSKVAGPALLSWSVCFPFLLRRQHLFVHLCEVGPLGAADSVVLLHLQHPRCLSAIFFMELCSNSTLLHQTEHPGLCALSSRVCPQPAQLSVVFQCHHVGSPGSPGGARKTSTEAGASPVP